MAFGQKKKKSAADDEDLDITPMIDVTFLLLIFFMVSSTMQEPPRVQIPPAVHGIGVSKQDSIFLTIFKTEDDPEIYLSDGNKENGPVSMEEVTQFVRQEIAQNKLNVIIKADRDVQSGFVEEVARAANDNDSDLKFYVGVVDKK